MGSHQKHVCDAGFEGSAVVHKTPNGQSSVEFTRLFTNVLDIDNVELLNVGEEDVESLREMLVPGLSQDPWSPLFVGPSECDGELVLRLPFNFTKSMSWELTHILFRASHPPAPLCYPPRSAALIVNRSSVTFSDFDDADAVVVPLQEIAGGALLAHLEPFHLKGTFRRVISVAIRLSTNMAGASDIEDELPQDAQVFFNDIALFGKPGEKVVRDRMWDDRANLIVSPVLTRRRWGEEISERPDADQENDQDDLNEAEPVPAQGAPADHDEPMVAVGASEGRRGLPMPTAGDVPGHDGPMHMNARGGRVGAARHNAFRQMRAHNVARQRDGAAYHAAELEERNAFGRREEMLDEDDENLDEP